MPAESRVHRRLRQADPGQPLRRPDPVPPYPVRRPSATVGEVRVRRPGPQGGRGGQRGHPVLGGAVLGPRQRGSPVPPDQRGRGRGGRAVPREERVLPSRRAGGAGPAAHAGGQRHLPRMGPVHRTGRDHPRLLPAPAVGREGLGGGRPDGAGGHGDLRRAVRVDAGPGPRPGRRPHRHGFVPGQRRPLRPGHEPSSPAPTPTRTSGTSGLSPGPSPTAASRPPPGSEPGSPSLAGGHRATTAAFRLPLLNSPSPSTHYHTEE